MPCTVNITFRFTLVTGQITLNEIVFRLKLLRDPLMLKIAEQILISDDALINERLANTDVYPSNARKGLG